MADRYQELYRLPSKLYLEGSPIIIEAGALLKDNQEDKVLVQLKLRNILNRKIVACKVNIHAFEPGEKEPAGAVEFTYLDVNKRIGEEFGVKTPIYLPDNKTRFFTVEIEKVVFEDNSVWISQNAEWITVPKQKRLEEKLTDRELIKQYKIEVGDDCTYYPELSNGLFMCTCGTVNMVSSHCYNCKRNYTRLIEALDETTLKANCEERLRKEHEEREAEERQAAIEAEEVRVKREESLQKQKRILKIVLPFAILVTVIAILTPTVIKPTVNNEISYRDAKQLLSDGDYDNAKKAFQELGEYRDASSMVLECDYQKADQAFSEGKYLFAINIWEQIVEYSDSSSRIEETEEELYEEDYQDALELKEQGKYADAKTLFSTLHDYKDSLEQKEECSELKKGEDYENAIALVNEGQYEEGIKLLKSISGYKDSDDLYMSTSYDYGCQLMEDGDYFEAIKYFDNSEGYKDTSTKNKEAKYKFVSTTKSISVEVYSYLKELVSDNYAGAQELFDEKFTWKVKITINSKTIGGTDSSSISKYDPVVVHFLISGGPPAELGETINVISQYTLPNGESGTRNIGEMKRGEGDNYGWFDGLYINPAYGATGTFSVRFYDDNGNLLGSGSVKITN